MKPHCITTLQTLEAFAVEICFFWGDLAAVTGTRRGEGMAVGHSSLFKDSSTTVAQVRALLPGRHSNNVT